MDVVAIVANAPQAMNVMRTLCAPRSGAFPPAVMASSADLMGAEEYADPALWEKHAHPRVSAWSMGVRRSAMESSVDPMDAEISVVRVRAVRRVVPMGNVSRSAPHPVLESLAETTGVEGHVGVASAIKPVRLEPANPNAVPTAWARSVEMMAVADSVENVRKEKTARAEPVEPIAPPTAWARSVEMMAVADSVEPALEEKFARAASVEAIAPPTVQPRIAGVTDVVEIAVSALREPLAPPMESVPSRAVRRKVAVSPYALQTRNVTREKSVAMPWTLDLAPAPSPFSATWSLRKEERREEAAVATAVHRWRRPVVVDAPVRIASAPRTRSAATQDGTPSAWTYAPIPAVDVAEGVALSERVAGAPVAMAVHRWTRPDVVDAPVKIASAPRTRSAATRDGTPSAWAYAPIPAADVAEGVALSERVAGAATDRDARNQTSRAAVDVPVKAVSAHRIRFAVILPGTPFA